MSTCLFLPGVPFTPTPSLKSRRSCTQQVTNAVASTGSNSPKIPQSRGTGLDPKQYTHSWGDRTGSQTVDEGGCLKLMIVRILHLHSKSPIMLFDDFNTMFWHMSALILALFPISHRQPTQERVQFYTGGANDRFHQPLSNATVVDHIVVNRLGRSLLHKPLINHESDISDHWPICPALCVNSKKVGHPPCPPLTSTLKFHMTSSKKVVPSIVLNHSQ